MEIQDGKGRQLENVALPTLPCLSGLKNRTKKLLHVMCHHNQTEAGVLPITYYYTTLHTTILHTTIWSTSNALPCYSMVASVHVYCILNIFDNHGHSLQKEYRFLCARVPSDTIPFYYYQPVTLYFGKWQRDEIKQRSLICEEVQSKCQLTGSSLPQEKMFLLKFERF